MLERARRAAVPFFVFAVVLIARLVLLPTTPTEWDSVQLSLGVSNFDVRVQSPHSPGYWLYLFFGRVFEFITPLDASRSLSVVAALASASAASVAWLTGQRFGSRALAVAFTVLVASNPFVWFYGLVPNAYTFDLLAVLIFLNLALRSEITKREVFIGAITLGLAAGFRQSALYIFGPVVLYLLVRAKVSLKTFVVALGLGVVSILVWLVPASLDQPGGISVLYQQTMSMWRAAADSSSLLAGAPAHAAWNNVGKATATPIVALLVLALVSVALTVVALIARRHAATNEMPMRRALFVIGLTVLPSLLVTTVGYYGKPGYVLSYLPPMILLFCLPVLFMPKVLRVIASLVLALVAVGWTYQFTSTQALLPRQYVDRDPWFTKTAFGTPFQDYTLDTIRVYDKDTQQYLALDDVAKPNDTLVYLGQEGVGRFRHLSYALPTLVHELVQDDPNIPCTLAFEGKLANCVADARTVKVAPGGRALFIANAPSDAIKALAETGAAEPIALSTGPTVFAVEPGTVVGDLPVIVDTNLAVEIRPTYT